MAGCDRPEPRAVLPQEHDRRGGPVEQRRQTRARAGPARGTVVVSCDNWTSRSGRLAEITRQADVLIVAAGVPNFIGLEHVAEGTVLINVGINPVTDPESVRVRLVGDIDLPAVLHLARAATPVPGGVGPVTDVWLMKNCVSAARDHSSLARPATPAEETTSSNPDRRSTRRRHGI
jgi:hypothetical protein